ncbi:hypothetical protein EWM64_g6215 [Hericium alpestre]|uniref:Major facilitator superfamily (MFS) profile domain-containing protein n=1 Tax=Hericium alpestre TaxID=135208 RepID=A0A4Y9ZU74_9AGAM|nr:hypothetical protein EWM64_g6215 [Hericium alpestre]
MPQPLSTTAITLTLLFRPVGKIILGMLSDRFGRKWPLVVNLLLCAAFELGSSFVQTFNQFLATRCLFGIAMGGIWGLASSTALENLPAEARGFGSGVVQLGDHASIATIIAECGAIAGSAVSGVLSQYFGRRLVMIIFNVLICVFIPLWIIPSSFSALSASAFCVQATFPGVTYQLGDMISAASAQIEATGGNNFKKTVLKDSVPTVVPNYAPVQGILMGAVVAFCIILLVIGPEKHGYLFENDKAAFEEKAPLTEGVVGEGSVEGDPVGEKQDDVKKLEAIPV